MKKFILLIAAAFIIVAAAAVLLRLITPEDRWACVDGEWVMEGNPTDPRPSEPCNGAPINGNGGAEDDMIRVSSPLGGSSVISPLTVEGQARGNWYFEADFPLELVSADGTVLAAGIATAQGDWMTEDFVPFSAELNFNVTAATDAELVLHKDNPSGLSEFDDERRITLILMPGDNMSIEVYFPNTVFDPEMADCGRTYAVTRTVPRTLAVGQAALAELLAGPTDAEREDGYITSINDGVRINSLRVEDQTAYADFDEQLEFQVGGSCRVTSIRAQVEDTLKQFPTVDNVIISVNGRIEDILQP